MSPSFESTLFAKILLFFLNYWRYCSPWNYEINRASHRGRLREKEHLFRYRAYFEENLSRFVRARAHVRALMTWTRAPYGCAMQCQGVILKASGFSLSMFPVWNYDSKSFRQQLVNSRYNIVRKVKLEKSWKQLRSWIWQLSTKDICLTCPYRQNVYFPIRSWHFVQWISIWIKSDFYESLKTWKSSTRAADHMIDMLRAVT